MEAKAKTQAKDRQPDQHIGQGKSFSSEFWFRHDGHHS